MKVRRYILKIINLQVNGKATRMYHFTLNGMDKPEEIDNTKCGSCVKLRVTYIARESLKLDIHLSTSFQDIYLRSM